LFRRHSSLFLFFSFILLLLLLCPSLLFSQDKFYNYYDSGLKYINKGDWLRAIASFESAISLEFEDTKRKRTYGTRFIQYYPHRELGISYYNLGEYGNARKELELSIAYQKTKRAEEFLTKMKGLGEGPGSEDIAALEELKRIEEEKEKIKAEEERLAKERERIAKKEAKKREEELKRQKKLLEEERRRVEAKKVKSIPPGMLAYDPSKVTQVGSRLSIAVLPFSSTEETQELIETVTEKLITQLVNFRRFMVIERQAMEAIMKEQALSMSGLVDEKFATRAGKIVGADVIVIGSINVLPTFSKVNARLIDTETSETIVAKEALSQETNIESIEDIVEKLSIMIYNDLPIVEGYIVSVEPETIYLDIGSEVGVRKGTKCVAFSEGAEIVHPITGEVLGKKVVKLGELVVIQVQDKLAMARFVEDEEGTVKLGDKVVVK